jgi:hypothetical protein
MQRVRQGMQVQVKMQDPPKPPESPVAKHPDKETRRQGDKDKAEHGAGTARSES